MILRKKDVLKEISSELEVDNTRWYQHLPSEKISAWRKSSRKKFMAVICWKVSCALCDVAVYENDGWVWLEERAAQVDC